MESMSGTIQWDALSTSNSMSPNSIEIGLETTNNSHSVTYADNDYFQFNQWEGTNGSWNYQTNPGDTSSNDPPYWWWLTIPANGNAGGQGETQCC